MSSDHPPSYPKRNDHYRRQDRSRHHSRHDVSEGWSNTQHHHRPQQSGPNGWQAGSHRRWNNNEINYPKQQYPKKDQIYQWEEQQWDGSSQENGSWDTRATSQPYYQDQDGQSGHDVDEWGREVRRGRRQSPTPDDQPRRHVSHQPLPKYHRGHYAEHRQPQNHDRNRYHGYDQRKRRHSPQRDQRWECQPFNGPNKRRRTDEHETFQAQEYQDDRTRFRSQHTEPQSDWIEHQYSYDHGPSQNPSSHETASQHNGDWDYLPNDMPENRWQAPPPRLPEPAFSSNWPPAPPPSGTWHGPHPLPPTVHLPLPLHPPIPAQPPVLHAPYPPARNDFFDYSSPYLPRLELSPTRHGPTAPVPRHFSAEPNFSRPLEKSHPVLPDVAPARGPALRHQNNVSFGNHHIKKGRSALVRRFFEADDEEEPVMDCVPNTISGFPPAVHQAPEGPLQQVDHIPDVPFTMPELPAKPVISPTQPAALPSPQSHSLPSRPATPKETQGGIIHAPLSPVPKSSQDLRPSVAEVTVPTPPITDSPEHDGLALVVTPIPIGQTGQRPPKATEPFEFLGLVGQGAYGKVFKARERATGALVALKKVKSEHTQDGFPVTGLREVKLLQSLKHDNVVTLREMVSRKGDIFLKFEYVPHDLVGLLKQQHITLEHAHIKSLMHQLLKGLAYIHAKGVLHRDLKAANLLVTANGTLKLADFGLARFYYKRNTKGDYTNRVCTIWYRPPELMLGLTVYGPEVDIWSAGCIFMEMFLKEAPFRGEDEIRQLHRVYASLGSPKADYCPELLAAPWYSLMPPVEEYDNVFALEWSELLPLEVVTLVEKLLRMDRHARPSATEAMEDSYFSSEPLPRPPDLTSLSVDCHEYDYAKKDRRKDDKPRLRPRKAPIASTAAK